MATGGKNRADIAVADSFTISITHITGFSRWFLRFVLSGLLIVVISASSAFAQQNLNWDANGVLPVSGGTGNWDTTTPLWFNGVTFQAWNNAGLDNAIFGAAAGNVRLTVPITVHDMTFNPGGYVFPSVGTVALTFGGVNPTVTTNGDFTQFFFPLAGSTGFTKSGSGSLQLGGTSAGYTGVTIVNAGTLVVSNSLALGFVTAASNLVLNSGATIVFSSPSFNHNYTLTGGVVNLQITGISTVISGSPTLTAPTMLNFNGTGTSGSLSGNLTDTGANILSLTKSDTGRITLSGNNSYTGSTTVTRGRLQLNSAGALSSGSNLVFNGAAGTGGSIELTSNFGIFTRGLGTGSGQVQWTGDGGFLSSGTAGIVNLGGAGAMVTWGSGGFVLDGNRLILGTSSNNNLDFQNDIDLSGGVRPIQGDGGKNPGHARMNGILSGSGGLSQVGNGLLELTGSNTYTGGTFLTSGTLVVSANVNLGASSGTLTFDGGTLQNTGAFTTARNVTINALGGFLVTDADLVESGIASGVGRLTKTGLASLTLTGANIYTGGTTISAGTLQIGNGGASGSIVGNVTNNGALNFNRSDTVIFAGVVMGAGTLNQTGTGTTILTAANTFSGGTTISAGTLQIGNGGNIGSIVGNVSNTGTFAFNRSDASTYGGVVSGPGAVRQGGTGTTILTGANIYTGGTTISAGTLQIGNGGTSGSIIGNVINDSVLVFNRSDFIIFDGAVSGAGSVKQAGPGTTLLTGINSYTGDTEISAGTLALSTNASIAASSALIDNGTFDISAVSGAASISSLSGSGSVALGPNVMILTRANGVFDGMILGSGGLRVASGSETLAGENTYTGGTSIDGNAVLAIGDGGATGSITGKIANAGTLIFDRSDTITFDGAVSGSGTVRQRGAGMTILTGISTYTGGTIVLGGTLAGSSTAFGMGPVQNNATLVIDQGVDADLANVLQGNGSFLKRGGGTLTLTGNSASYSGTTSILAGTLAVNGKLGGTVNVLSPSFLGGDGTVGAINVESGGTLAPGAPHGTMTAEGTVIFASGSTLEVRLDPANVTTLLHVNGVAQIDGGTVKMATEGSVFRTGARYMILTADGGRSGQFAGLSETLPLLDMTLVYDSRNVYVDVSRNSTTLCSLAVTHNQCAISTADTELGSDNLAVAAVRSLPDLASIRDALDFLSGEVHASAKGMMLEGSHLVTDIVIDRARQFSAPGGVEMTGLIQPAQGGFLTGHTIWGQGFGSWNNRAGDGNAASATGAMSGLFVGTDALVGDRLRIGIAAGYSASVLDVDRRKSVADSADYHLALYGGTRLGPVGLRFGAAYSWHDIETRRTIVFSGFSDVERARYSANSAQIFGEAGYSMPFDKVEAEPFVRVAAVSLDTAGYSESSGPAALNAANDNDQALFTTLGMHVAMPISVSSDLMAMTQATLGWRHALGDVLPASTFSAGGGSQFSVVGVPMAVDALVVEAGFEFAVSEDVSLNVLYNGQLSRHSTDNGVRGQLVLHF